MVEHPIQNIKENLSKSKLRRPKEPILIVEDRVENQTLLTAVCKKLGVSSEIAENGQIALNKATKHKYSLYLVDLMMPVMDGKTFLTKIKEVDPHAVCVVQTAKDHNEDIIEIMKLGVYDYLIKPFHIEILVDRLEKAIEYVYLKQMELDLLEAEHQELKSHLEWLNYKESRRKSKESNAEIHTILNLQTTLNQGSGIGSMTTIIDSINQSKEESGDSYKISKEFWDLLLENNQHTFTMLKGMERSVEILQGSVNLKPISSDDLLKELPLVISEFRTEIESRSLKVNLPIVKTKVKLSCDLEMFRLVLKEVVLNGIKYSDRDSNFDFFVTNVDGYFCLSVKNTIREDEYEKLLPAYEKQLILPFFRIHPPVEEFYKKEPFSLGLGLTMVDFLLKKHHGMFFLRNAVDHTSEKTTCVIAELFLPINETKDT